MDFRATRATIADFAARHEIPVDVAGVELRADRDVERRDADGVDTLTGCVLRRDGLDRVVVAHARDRRTSGSARCAEVFDLPLDRRRRRGARRALARACAPRTRPGWPPTRAA